MRIHTVDKFELQYTGQRIDSMHELLSRVFVDMQDGKLSMSDVAAAISMGLDGHEVRAITPDIATDKTLHCQLTFDTGIMSSDMLGFFWMLKWINALACLSLDEPCNCLISGYVLDFYIKDSELTGMLVFDQINNRDAQQSVYKLLKIDIAENQVTEYDVSGFSIRDGQFDTANLNAIFDNLIYDPLDYKVGWILAADEFSIMLSYTGDPDLTDGILAKQLPLTRQDIESII